MSESESSERTAVFWSLNEGVVFVWKITSVLSVMIRQITEKAIAGWARKPLAFSHAVRLLRESLACTRVKKNGPGPTRVASSRLFKADSILCSISCFFITNSLTLRGFKTCPDCIFPCNKFPKVFSNCSLPGVVTIRLKALLCSWFRWPVDN